MTENKRTILVSIDRDLLKRRELQTYDRAYYLLTLVNLAAQAEGHYSAGDTIVRLEAGEFVSSHERIGKLWGVNRQAARKILDALKRAGAIEWDDAVKVRVPGHDAPVGTVFRIPWLVPDTQ